MGLIVVGEAEISEVATFTTECATYVSDALIWHTNTMHNLEITALCGITCLSPVAFDGSQSCTSAGFRKMMQCITYRVLANIRPQALSFLIPDSADRTEVIRIIVGDVVCNRNRHFWIHT